MLVTSGIPGPLHPLRTEASKCCKVHFRWHSPAFHCSVADGEAATAGTPVGYEKLGHLTKRAVPILGGDRCQ